MSSTVIKIESLWKEYRYGVVSQGYLFRDVQSWWAKVRGKEDPNERIDSKPKSHLPTVDEKPQEEDGVDPKSANPHSAIPNPKSIDRFWALKDINLEIKQGEILGIIGRNGAGKSTLLKILSRVTAPTKGCIKVNGRIGSLLEVGTGFHPELTGRENIFLNGAILGMRKKEIRNKFDEIVAFAEIEKFIDTPVKRYSSGMYVRLAFAVAAHLDPEILVVDEVLAVGDAQFQKKCLGKMGDVAKQGRTILFVSHNMGAIETLCPGCLLIENGTAKRHGPTHAIVQEFLTTRTLRHVRDPRPDQRATISRVECRDRNGRPCNAVQMGDGLAVVIYYDVKGLLEPLGFGISIENQQGQRIFGVNTNSQDLYTRRDTSVNRAIVNFPRIALCPGNYTITVAIQAKYGGLVDWFDNAVLFSVLTNDLDKTGRLATAQNGLVWLDHSWEL